MTHGTTRSTHRNGFSAAARLVLFLLALAVAFGHASAAEAAKNVILMIADGAGFNTWLATSMYQGKVGRQVYDEPGWAAYACTTYPLTRSGKPTGTGEQDVGLVYDASKAWDKELVTTKPGRPGVFAGYAFLKSTPTDSAAAGTAMASGQKTYDSAINWTDRDQPLAGRTIAELSKARGKAVGVVTTVEFSHATPACLGGAHNPDRDQYEEIANEMLDAPYLDVIMGAGHPEYDNNGRPASLPATYKYVGGEATWKQLRSGTHPAGWTLVATKDAFEGLASGPTPKKVLGVAQAATTLQESRSTAEAAWSAARSAQPYADPLNGNVPTLATMVRGALNCLDDDPDGFFLCVEGGAVDWANHSNHAGRMVEEQIDFLRALEAVVRWVGAHGGWDETLVIVTADHETGFLWGPASDSVPFDPIVDLGKGRLPALTYNSGSHTNSLVPLYARGAGSERFAALVTGTDRQAASAWHVSGRYVDNTAIFRVMRAAVAGPVPAAAGQPAAAGAR